MSFKHSIVEQNGGIVFTIEGKICSPEDSNELIDGLNELIEKKIQFLIIDINQLDYITSSGLNFFIRCLTRIRNIGGELIITGLHGNVEKLFNISKLNEIFTFSSTVEEGLKRLNAKKSMSVDVLLGLQWGDEGKGKIVDVLTPQYDIIARFQGGPNAGHTLEFEGIKHVLHTIPSGIFRKEVLNLIGNGVVIDPVVFQNEIEKLAPFNLDIKNTLLISKKAHVILPTHRLLDAASEAAKGKNKIGSTLKGIGPAYMDKTGRNGLRVGDILSENFMDKYNALVEKHRGMLDHYDGFEYNIEELEAAFFEGIELLRSLTCIDSEQYINDALKAGKKVLAEGAQGTLLDIDFGTYPFVTSSNTVTAGTCTGLGVAPTKIGNVIGIFKAYCTRVGSGPFPTELFDADGDQIRVDGNEFGSTTGRPRRCGWIDLPAMKYAIMVNGVTEMSMMKADVLSNFDEIKVCTHYMIKGEKVDVLPFDIIDDEIRPVYESLPGWKKDLTGLTSYADAPQELKDYVIYLERVLEVPITVVSVGPDRTQTLSNKA